MDQLQLGCWGNKLLGLGFLGDKLLGLGFSGNKLLGLGFGVISFRVYFRVSGNKFGGAGPQHNSAIVIDVATAVWMLKPC